MTLFVVVFVEKVFVKLKSESYRPHYKDMQIVAFLHHI
jgi:hypothetical protein